MDEQSPKLKANPLFALLYLALAQSFSILIVVPSILGAHVIFAFLVNGGDLQNLILSCGMLFFYSFVLFPVIISSSFIMGWPAFIVGYAVSLLFLHKQESRFWVWVSVLGAVGFVWSFGLAWRLSPPSYVLFLDNLKNFMGLCVFTASGCGFFMWLFVRYALKGHEALIEVENKQAEEIEMGVL